MATEKQLWELNRHSVPSTRFFNGSALELWEKACEYFEFCDRNPYWMTVQKNGKKKQSDGMILDDLYVPTMDDDTIDLPVKRMYSKVGFCIRIGLPKSFFAKYESYYEDDNMLLCIEVIGDIIEEHQLTNAASGFYKESLISKINNLTEKLAVDNNIKKVDIFKIGDQEISFE